MVRAWSVSTLLLLLAVSLCAADLPSSPTSGLAFIGALGGGGDAATLKDGRVIMFVVGRRRRGCHGGGREPSPQLGMPPQVRVHHGHRLLPVRRRRDCQLCLQCTYTCPSPSPLPSSSCCCLVSANSNPSITATLVRLFLPCTRAVRLLVRCPRPAVPCLHLPYVHPISCCHARLGLYVLALGPGSCITPAPPQSCRSK